MENDVKLNTPMSETEVTEISAKVESKATTDVTTKAETKAVATKQVTKDVITRNLAVLKDYRAFAESLKDTDLGARFTENKTIDGKVTEVINIDNMVTCLLTGAEIGLSPMTSLAYGRNLNLDAIQKVELGKTLGLSVTASLKNIFVFETGGNRQVYTGINVVEGCLNKHGIDIVIDEDYVPVYNYLNLQNKVQILEFNPERHIDVNDYNDAYVDKMMKEKGMVPVAKSISTYRTTVTLIRKEKKTTVSYTLQEAIDAELKSGVSSITGQQVKGKDNWNKHTRSLMRKMAIMIAARICANDLLNGMYSDFEISQAPTIPDEEINAQYVEAEIVN
ncbi:MAG: hypothetical protein HDQ88_04795 [Clostridia bacterium]|nr:hypothetical protein [Clostridia bacterium]